MTIRDRVLSRLREVPDGLTDAELARGLGISHQQANQACHHLEQAGVIARISGLGAIRNQAIEPTGEAVVTESERSPVTTPASMSSDPLWEGSVQRRLVSHLQDAGWTVHAAADTASRSRGVDVIAERDGTLLMIEVKGYPSHFYVRGPKAGQPKPTSPTLQAQHWFAGAMLKTLRTAHAHPEARVAMAFPDMPRYRSLLEETSQALEQLAITVFLVGERKTVAWGDEPPAGAA